MVRVESYRDLVVWQKSMALVAQTYRATTLWPTDERFGLTMQVRRAAVSVPANIAEGQGRSGPREMKHHLSIAHGSLAELETLLLIGKDLGYSDASNVEPLFASSNETSRMLRAMITRMT